MKNGCSRSLMIGFAFAQMVLSGLSFGAGTTYWVTGAGDTSDALDGVLTLREAVAAADDGDVVRSGAGMAGAVIRLVNGEISVEKSIVIEGFALGRPELLPAKANPGRLFSVEPGTVVTMRHLVFQDGVADQGGAIHSEGDLTMEFCRFENNEASVMGGAIFHRTRSLEMEGCVFERNEAPRAGAVAVTGMAFCNVDGCVFRENVSDDTVNTSFSGGAIFSQESQLGIQKSRFEENVAEGNGVALAVEGGEVIVLSCVFAGNASPPKQAKPGASISLFNADGFFSGSAIYGGTGRGLVAQNGEPLVMKNCTIAGNAGGGVSTFNNDLILENGLIWGNAGSTLRVTGTGALTATYSLVEGQDLTGQGAGNFDGTNPWVDPGFSQEIDPGRAPFVDGDLTPLFESVVVER